MIVKYDHMLKTYPTYISTNGHLYKYDGAIARSILQTASGMQA